MVLKEENDTFYSTVYWNATGQFELVLNVFVIIWVDLNLNRFG